jgi:hypothetical protein
MSQLDSSDFAAEPFLRDVLHSPALLRTDWLRSKSWSAVATEQHGYVSQRDLERLLQAIKALSDTSPIVISPSDAAASPNSQSFPLTVEGLNAAFREASFNFLITNSATQYVYHYTDEDFSLITGPTVFVETALGASIGAAWQDWCAYSTHPGWSKSEQNAFSHITEWYKDCDLEIVGDE